VFGSKFLGHRFGGELAARDECRVGFRRVWREAWSWLLSLAEELFDFEQGAGRGVDLKRIIEVL
jgi:hypothetical protein